MHNSFLIDFWFFNANINPVIQLNDIDVVRTSAIHQVQPHVTQRFFRVTKPLRLGGLLSHIDTLHISIFVSEKFLWTIKADVKSDGTTLVFVNSSKTCHWLHRFLVQSGLPAFALHRGVIKEERMEVN